MKISLGILACNESESIDSTLNSLFQQSLFADADSPNPIEIVVVPNGCSDNTADISRETLTELTEHSAHPDLHFSVMEVAEADKSNAWNLYVHHFADPQANYLFVMDADIQLLETHTLRNTIDSLEHNPAKQIAVDTPVKDIVFKPNKNPIEQLSVLVSASTANDYDVWICGQFYCGRAAILRQIWMPPGITSEDSFLTMVIRNSNCTSSPRPDRIVRVPNASHSFEALTDPQKLLRHEKRIVIGMTINYYLFEYLDRICPDLRLDAGTFIKQMNERDPLWLKHLLQNIVAQTGWWLIPTAWLWRRFENLKYHSWQQAILRFPVAVMALLVDAIVFFQANRDMRRGHHIGYW
jgi:glycosyltransferase involved in cell wall biosynthesis